MSFNEIINDTKPVLVDFYADWCQPCKMVTPILKQVKEQLGDQVKIIKINVDTNPSVSANYNIRSIPTLILFRNGRQIWNKVGVAATSEIINKIKETI
ncbi:MAG: thioredoxin [Bacteroidetes bacterium GWC2_33_15]|nr:MAG: thioredoxin [Bacteroidetes bacterium GWA2_33_15]OFX49191.1 MAG: thioredoxin [Bacteroidetes bacterium GWC2_33_15]OFX64660.1 MAG: thioredoxin [Bacteroidetes bacterium GWB2_32_14]OFX69132.1 MAG: thioredoxin [Bacteroidetes bacterium GWD2_33_33]HAN17641.1 thioredoxin [Bacteroidales bacterium]